MHHDVLCSAMSLYVRMLQSLVSAHGCGTRARAAGIGRAVAVLYAREGARVAIAYLPEEQADADVTRAAIIECHRHTAAMPVAPSGSPSATGGPQGGSGGSTKKEEGDHGGACLLLPGDLRQPAACRDAVARTVEHYGRLDILINNAATQRYHATLQTITEEDLRATFEARPMAQHTHTIDRVIGGPHRMLRTTSTHCRERESLPTHIQRERERGACQYMGHIALPPSSIDLQTTYA